MKQKRSARIKNWSLGDIKFCPSKNDVPNLPPCISLANLSSGGAGLWIQDSRVYLAPGQVLKGVIDAVNEKFDVRLEVIRKHNYIYGCRFLEPSQTLQKFLHNHYQVEEEAGKLVHVSEDSLASIEGGKPHWYSDGISELYYIESPMEKKVMQYRLTYRDHEINKYYRGKITYEMGEHAVLTASIRDDFIRFLNHINDLPFNYRNEIINDIKNLI